mmetsp:Transcript_11749/g.19160  ORF Transcript_11749/g.19160 Transcript_11749/m.19160 type:complete len:222 (-) Transcript_11749:1346-2011(-)
MIGFTVSGHASMSEDKMGYAHHFCNKSGFSTKCLVTASGSISLFRVRSSKTKPRRWGEFCQNKNTVLIASLGPDSDFIHFSRASRERSIDFHVCVRLGIPTVSALFRRRTLFCVSSKPVTFAETHSSNSSGDGFVFNCFTTLSRSSDSTATGSGGGGKTCSFICGGSIDSRNSRKHKVTSRSKHCLRKQHRGSVCRSDAICLDPTTWSHLSHPIFTPNVER